MSIIRKLHNWFTKSNEPSKEELKQNSIRRKLTNTETCCKELSILKLNIVNLQRLCVNGRQI